MSMLSREYFEEIDRQIAKAAAVRAKALAEWFVVPGATGSMGPAREKTLAEAAAERHDALAKAMAADIERRILGGAPPADAGSWRDREPLL